MVKCLLGHNKKLALFPISNIQLIGLKQEIEVVIVELLKGQSPIVQVLQSHDSTRSTCDQACKGQDRVQNKSVLGDEQSLD